MRRRHFCPSAGQPSHTAGRIIFDRGRSSLRHGGADQRPPPLPRLGRKIGGLAASSCFRASLRSSVNSAVQAASTACAVASASAHQGRDGGIIEDPSETIGLAPAVQFCLHRCGVEIAGTGVQHQHLLPQAVERGIGEGKAAEILLVAADRLRPTNGEGA